MLETSRATERSGGSAIDDSDVRAFKLSTVSLITASIIAVALLVFGVEDEVDSFLKLIVSAGDKR